MIELFTPILIPQTLVRVMGCELRLKHTTTDEEIAELLMAIADIFNGTLPPTVVEFSQSFLTCLNVAGIY